MKALLNFVLPGFFSTNNSSPRDAMASQNDETCDFTRLSAGDQETVRQYFFATSTLMQMVNTIRRNQRACDVDEVLTAFKKAERAYIWAGFQPFFPPAIQRLKEFTPKQVAESKLLARIAESEKAAVYSPAMDRHVNKLIRDLRAHVLVSSDIEHLFHK